MEVQETVTEEVTDSNSVKLEEVGTVEVLRKILKNKSSKLYSSVEIEQLICNQQVVGSSFPLKALKNKMRFPSYKRPIQYINNTPYLIHASYQLKDVRM